MRIATGQIEENPKAQKAAVRAAAGKKGGAARKASLAPSKRAAIAKKQRKLDGPQKQKSGLRQLVFRHQSFLEAAHYNVRKHLGFSEPIFVRF
jgi:hypothetical protein